MATVSTPHFMKACRSSFMIFTVTIWIPMRSDSVQLASKLKTAVDVAALLLRNSVLNTYSLMILSLTCIMTINSLRVQKYSFFQMFAQKMY